MPSSILKSLINLFLLSVISLLLLAFAQRKSYWPFLPYSMYSEFRAGVVYRLNGVGTLESGEKVQINVFELLKPGDQNKILAAVLEFKAKNPAKFREVLEDIKDKYNQRHPAKLKGLALEKQIWTAKAERNSMPQLLETLPIGALD